MHATLSMCEMQRDCKYVSAYCNAGSAEDLGKSAYCNIYRGLSAYRNVNFAESAYRNMCRIMTQNCNI